MSAVCRKISPAMMSAVHEVLAALVHLADLFHPRAALLHQPARVFAAGEPFADGVEAAALVHPHDQTDEVVCG